MYITHRKISVLMKLHVHGREILDSRYIIVQNLQILVSNFIRYVRPKAVTVLGSIYILVVHQYVNKLILFLVTMNVTLQQRQLLACLVDVAF